MMRTLIRYGALAGAVVLGACELSVANPNQPGIDRVATTPADLENFIGTQYRRWHTAMYGSLSNQWGMANVQSFEDFSSLSNNCMGQRVGLGPRAANNNDIGNGCSTEQSRTYNIHSEVGRGMSNALRKMDEGLSFGPDAQNDRNRAFAEFLRGLSLGYLALVYDSASITKADDPLTPAGTAEDGVLSGYKDVMAEALVALGNAITSASKPAGTAWPLPGNWMFSPTSMTQAEFIKVVRSYRARFRASNARTPAERAAVDWAAVVADAQNGITADHQNTTSTVTGPSNSWVSQWLTWSTWHQMTPFVIGMADNSGSYAAWTALSVGNRGAGGPFFMTTPDLRFPQGATRVAQQADFSDSDCNGPSAVCKRYFRNRPTGSDNTSGATWGHSNYDWTRFISWKVSGSGTANNGPYTFMTKAEIDLLQAEGLYRMGNYAGAAALINLTRTAANKGGLPAITAFDATTAVPGGADCVPKVPVGPTYTTIACGNMLEALKWEKRMETAYTHFMAWFLDSRGWGDLPEGTGVHWAPPYQDLQTRRLPVYSTGGTTGNPGSAAKGTYGW